MASQVPYTGTLDVSPQFSPMSPAHIDTPIAAFGGTVAQAVEHLGDTETGVGKELFARAEAFQTLNEQVKADSAAADLNDKYTKRYLELDNLKGQERVAALDKWNKDLEADRQKGMAGLSPYGQAQYIRDSRRLQSQTMWYGARLAKQGQDDANNAAHENAAKAEVNNYSTVNPKDDKDFYDHADRIKQHYAALVHTNDKLGGFAPGTKESDDAVRPLASKDVGAMITAKIGADPQKAMDLLEGSKSKGLLTEQEYDTLKPKIQYALTEKKANAAGRQYGAENRNLIQQQNAGAFIAGARAKAAELFPGDDDDAKQGQENYLNSALGRADLENRREDEAYRGTWKELQAATDGSNTNGKVPLTPEEAFQDPKVRRLYDSLPEKSPLRNEFAEQIRRNNRTNGWVANDEGNKQYSDLLNVLKDEHASPEDMDAALKYKTMGSQMTIEQRTAIDKLQDSVLNQQSNKEHVNSAITLPAVQDALTAAGLTDKTSEAYKLFFTKFTEAIGDLASAQHRTVGDEKTLGEIATKLTYSMATRAWYNPMNLVSSAPQRTFENFFENHPDAKAAAVGKWKREHGGVLPTDAELQTQEPLYFRAFFSALSQPGKSTNRVVPKTPVAQQ